MTRTARCPSCQSRYPRKDCATCGQPTPPASGAKPTVETADMFDRPFVRGSDTSEAAADNISEPVARTQRWMILRYVVEHDGATDDELERQLGMKGSAVRPRRGALVKSGLLRDSGKKGLTRSTQPAVLWVATTDGHAEYERMRLGKAAA